MNASWKSLTSIETIDDIKADSHDRPQLIFKHSTTCPLSSIAKARLDDVSEDLSTQLDWHYLDLLSYRPVSNHIAEEFAVHHESPQVIIVWKGETTYDESHLDISEMEIAHHLDFLFKKND